MQALVIIALICLPILLLAKPLLLSQKPKLKVKDDYFNIDNISQRHRESMVSELDNDLGVIEAVRRNTEYEEDLYDIVPSHMQK